MHSKFIFCFKKLEHYLVTKNYSNIEEILYQTLYPQYYNHIIKILYGKTQTYFEKKKLLNVGMDNREVQKTFQSVKNLSKGEKIICWLLLKKMYFGATTVLYGIGRKNRG